MIGTRLSDRFEITGELGRGGMGVVYLAQDPVLGRDVAVKMVALGDAPEVNEQRFRREARVVAGLDHPAIVPIFDFGRHQDFLYFVMPVVGGTTLFDLIGDGSLKQGEMLEIIAQIAEALDYSSTHGVIHRDVKPENIMVTRQGTSVRARIMDFGLALKDAGSRITKTGQLPGTLAYLSPEHILSLDVDGRSDLYSLGTILYECLAGEPPFTGSQGTVLFRIVHEDPPPLEIDARLMSILERCLAKEPEDRPGSGAELAFDLRIYRESLSEGARQQPPMSRQQRRQQAPRASSPPLIGRAEELNKLTRRLDLALAGRCQLALVGGEAGIGTTRLLFELAQRARARGVRVVRGRFPGQEGTFPHHGFCELIQDFCRTPTDASGSEIPEMADLAPELLKRFPVLGEIAELRAAVGHRRVTSQEEPARDDQPVVFELLAKTLIRLAAGQPVVLVLENLHLGETSVPALEYLVRRLGATPTFIVGSFRSSEVRKRHEVTRLLRDFAGDPCFTSLQLTALTPKEHQDLVLGLLESASGLALRVDKELAERLYEVTEGNPFFARELVHALFDAGDVERDDGGHWVLSSQAQVAATLPETIQQAVEARLERLPDDLLTTLRTASVLGRSFAVEDLKRLVDSREGIDEAVDQLIREGLLEEDRRRSGGDAVSFSSGVVREVLHGLLTRRRRRHLHRRYAARLEERHSGRLERVYPQLVYHFSEGDEAVKTVAYALMLARMSAGAISPTDTIRAARTALGFVEDEDLDDSGEVEGELRLLLASALRTVGNVVGALREASRAVRAYLDRGQHGPAAAACLMAAETTWRIRRVDETRHWLGQGIELARAGGAGRQLCGLLTLAATVANLRGEHAKARMYLEEVDTLNACVPGSSAERQFPSSSVVLPSDRALEGDPGGESEAQSAKTLSAAVTSPSREAIASELRVPLPAAFDDLDPALALFVEPAEVVPNIFETLTRVGEGACIEPCLASRVQVSEDSQQVQVELREGVRFHDGRQLTARDVRYSFERLLRSPYAGVKTALMPIRGARELADHQTDRLEGVRVHSSRELSIELEKPVAFFPAMLSNPMIGIVPEGTSDFIGNWQEGLAGTGPFRVVGILPQERVELEANPNYWRPGLPRCRRLSFELGMAAGRVNQAFRSGELSIASGLSPGDVEGLRREPEYLQGFRESPGFSTYFLVPNSRRGPLAELRVRQALERALDVEAVVQASLGPLGLPAHGLISPGLPGHEGRSRRKPSESSTSSTLARLRIAVSVHSAYTGQYAHVWQRLRDTLAAAGVELEVLDLTMPEALERIKQGDVDLAAARRIAAYPDSDAFVNIFHSRDGLLGQMLGSREVDRLIEKGRSQTDPALRHATYREIEQIFERESLLIPLFDEQICCLARPEVQGLRLRLGWPKVAYEELSLVY